MRKLKSLVFLLLLGCFLFTVPVFAADSSSTSQYQEVQKNLLTGEVTTFESMPITYDNFLATDSYIPADLQKSSRKIIGSDDRTQVTNTRQFPYTAVLQLKIKFPNSSDIYVGTGWMYGPGVAMTAGHCVYDKELGGWAERIEVYPARNGNEKPFGYYCPINLSTDKKYIESQDPDFDWGLMVFEANIGDFLGYFGADANTEDLFSRFLTLTGYPSEKNYQLWTMEGPVSKNGSLTFEYLIDTTGGQSGSPVYQYDASDDTSYRVRGIHVRGDNSIILPGNEAVRITSSLKAIMDKYR